MDRLLHGIGVDVVALADTADVALQAFSSRFGVDSRVEASTCAALTMTSQLVVSSFMALVLEVIYEDFTKFGLSRWDRMQLGIQDHFEQKCQAFTSTVPRYDL